MMKTSQKDSLTILLILAVVCFIVVRGVMLLDHLAETVLHADYTSQAALANDTTFQARVKIAAFSAAIAISNEATTVPNHAKRIAFAQVFTTASDSYIPKLAFGVAADATITAGSSDAALQTRLNAIWDTFAGKDITLCS